MVTFNKKSYTVEVPYGDMTEWRMAVSDIIQALYSMDEGMKTGNNFYYLLNLLDNMIPDEDQIRSICT